MQLKPFAAVFSKHGNGCVGQPDRASPRYQRGGKPGLRSNWLAPDFLRYLTRHEKKLISEARGQQGIRIQSSSSSSCFFFDALTATTFAVAVAASTSTCCFVWPTISETWKYMVP